MKKLERPSIALLSIGFLVCLAGCGEKPLTITYDRPAEYNISESIRRIAIAEFGGKTALDRKFGDVAADELASSLDAYNKKYDRYELIDRKRLQAILDERDWQLAIADTASAAQVGKIADVEAMIYGSVSVSSRDVRASRMGFDIGRRKPKTVYYTRRYCMASVNFTMDDIRTSKTLATVTLTREYDSDKDEGDNGGGIGKALGFGGDGPPPTDQILTRLIYECVGQFVGKISPHTETVTEKMETGKSKIVRTGNKLARAGDYDEALVCYTRAMESHPDDDGAAFNAGLIYEAMGKLEEAAEYYTRAFDLNDKEKYIFARKRVRAGTD